MGQTVNCTKNTLLSKHPCIIWSSSNHACISSILLFCFPYKGVNHYDWYPSPAHYRVVECVCGNSMLLWRIWFQLVTRWHHSYPHILSSFLHSRRTGSFLVNLYLYQLRRHNMIVGRLWLCLGVARPQCCTETVVKSSSVWRDSVVLVKSFSCCCQSNVWLW